jgi:murein peptide amidase A
MEEPRKEAKVIHEKSWCVSRKGRDIPLFASGDLDKNDHPLLFLGGVHGDEPEGVELAEKTLAFLLKDAPKIQIPWILIPCLNVDGYLDGQRVNGAGVDLNRNYATKNWSPDFEKERYFPGTHAGSEPETQGMMKLIKDFDPREIIHCHSWHPCVVCTGAPGRADADRLAKVSGYEVVETIGYPTPGSLSAYGWAENGIPVICIEEQEKTPLPEIWPHFEQAIRDIFLDPSLRRDNLK